MSVSEVSRRIAIIALAVIGIVALGTSGVGGGAHPLAATAEALPRSLLAAIATEIPTEATPAASPAGPSAPPGVGPIPATPPGIVDTLAKLRAGAPPAALLTWAARTDDPESAVALLEARDPRLRMAAALALRGVRTRPTVAAAMAKLREREPDPRVRQALDPASDPARSVDVVWDARGPSGAPDYRTTIAIDGAGRARSIP